MVPQDRSLNDARLVHPLSWVGFGGGFVALLLGVGGGISSSNPPGFNANWPCAWGACFLAIGLAVASCFLRRNRGTRLVASIAIGLALLGSWCPTASYYGNYHSYPWIVVFGLGGLSVVGGSLSGLRLLPLASAAFLVFWFYAAFLPSKGDYPVTLEAGGLECKLLTTNSFELRDLAGRELSRIVDLSHVQIEGNVGPLIEVQCWSPMPEHDVDRTPKGPTVTMYGRVFAPRWARSFNLRIVVTRWPVQAGPAVSFPLETLPRQPLAASRGRYHLEISNVGWGRTSNSLPSEKCLSMSVSYSGFSYGGMMGGEFRVVDNLGNVIPTAASSVQGSPSGTTITMELKAIDPKATTLRVELIGENEAKDSEVVFAFDRLPPPD